MRLLCTLHIGCLWRFQRKPFRFVSFQHHSLLNTFLFPSSRCVQFFLKFFLCAAPSSLFAVVKVGRCIYQMRERVSEWAVEKRTKLNRKCERTKRCLHSVTHGVDVSVSAGCKGEYLYRRANYTYTHDIYTFAGWTIKTQHFTVRSLNRN